MFVVESMILLGAKLDMTRLHSGSETARIHAVWGKWADVEPQAQNMSTPLRDRIKHTEQRHPANGHVVARQPTVCNYALLGELRWRHVGREIGVASGEYPLRTRSWPAASGVQFSSSALSCSTAIALAAIPSNTG